tara:strand:+ start:130 stop:549 length:420 start_codon:yes stop_codon:yes gene_type:complete
MITYISLFLISFLSATIFPLTSELTLAGLINTDKYNSLILIVAASLGNILGSVFNWVLGFYLLKHIDKKWFFFKKEQITSASKWFNKFGLWSLLLAWTPIIGDPLTFVSGILRVNFFLFLILVSIGKICRYFFIYILVN